jgi:ABC-type multidrug transport system fused ATPase/permease subunit
MEDLGAPDTGSPRRFLLWLASRQAGTLTLAMLFGIGWMLPGALIGLAVEKTIDVALTKPYSVSALVLWSFVIFLLGLVQAICGMYRHQLAVTNWMKGTYGAIQVVGRHLSVHGVAVVDEIPSGDVVNTVASDAMRIGGAFDVMARFVGAVASWIVVNVILLTTSLQLGLITLIGVPVLGAFSVPLMKPLHRTQAAQREAAGRLAAMASDTVAGLRILRGVGGEDVFHANYASQSQLVRRAGNKVAAPQAGLESGQVLLPALLTIVIIYIAGHDIVDGSLTAGQLALFFYLATFLTTPLRTSIEYVVATTRAYVGARKVIAILNSSSTIPDPPSPEPWPAAAASFEDSRSGVSARAGQLVGLVTETTDEAAAIADRLGRFVADIDGVCVDGRPLGDFSLADTRSRIVVSEVEPRLFSGDLRNELAPHGHMSDDELLAALEAASATDVVDAFDDGLSAVVEERGRSFSGGQRQRITLARALLTRAELLILVEPTSAVDSHTEGRIASRLRAVRSGLTTIVATNSPLMLEQVDEVLLVSEGQVVARGAYGDLMLSEPALRRIVHRGGDE